MPNLIESPYPKFCDVDGDPLESGYLYFGEAGLNPITNQIQVYWDSALTVPASQPVRTKGGYPSNDGTPSRLYVSTNYSVTVQDKRQALVYTLLDSVDYFNSPGGQTVLKVDTMEDVQGLIPTDPNYQLSVGGFFDVGDAGGGLFSWDPTEDKANHDGGTIIDPDNTADLSVWDATQQGIWFTPGVGSGCWKRVYDEKTLHIDWFGTIGDEITDDAIPIKYVIDNVAEGTEIIFTNRHKVSRQTTFGVFQLLTDNVTLRFIGNAGFKADDSFLSSGSGFLFGVGEDDVEHYNISIIGGTFDGNKANQTFALFGLAINSVKKFLLSGSVFDSFLGSGAATRSYCEGTIENCDFTSNDIHGLQCGSQGESYLNGEAWVNVSNCRFIENGGFGVDVSGDDAITGPELINKTNITNCEFISNGTNAALSNLKVTKTRHANVSNCYFFTSGLVLDSHIRVTSTYSAGLLDVDYLTIDSCKFDGEVNEGTIFAEGNANTLNITNNEFNAITGTQKYFILTRAPGVISNNNFVGTPTLFGMVSYSSDVIIKDNYFELGNIAVKIISDPAFEMSVDIADIFITGNTFKATAALDYMIFIDSTALTTQERIHITGNSVAEDGFSITDMIRFRGNGIIDNVNVNANMIEGLNGVASIVGTITNVTKLYIKDNIPLRQSITFADGDTTPDVRTNDFWETANTAPTTITQLEGGFIGKDIYIYVNDANTTFSFSSPNLSGNGGVDYVAAVGDTIFCKYLQSRWRCTISQA